VRFILCPFYLNEAVFKKWPHKCNPSYLGGRDGRIVVPGQPSQKLARPYLKKQADLGMVAHSIIPATKEVEVGRSWFKARLGKKLARRYLNSKWEALSLNPSTTTKKKKKKKSSYKFFDPHPMIVLSHWTPVGL
jgi:hypothetical protein